MSACNATVINTVDQSAKVNTMKDDSAPHKCTPDASLLREIELLNQQIALLRSEINVLKAAAEFFYNEHLNQSNG
ncbi:MAG: hypothetical protein ACI87C_000921 [Paraperlucidibaca sp.]|jgi:hypothetical protein|tara:strand:- start:33 stop:257 length:225 start_codon:yes stop_codon:yes gene_type:complete